MATSAPDGVGADVRAAAMSGAPDRYIAATLAPPACQASLAAIAAFAAELAKVPASVSEAALGDIKLQWWRDSLADGRNGRLSGHPVADAMIGCLDRHKLDPALADEMIDARELDLAGGLPHDDAGLRQYLERIEGHAFRLALGVLGVPGAVAERMARPAGVAYGLARGLGRLPMLLHNGGLPLPADRLRAAGVAPDALAENASFSGFEAGVARVAQDLRELARAELDEVKPMLEGLDRGARAALLPLVLVGPYFRVQTRSTNACQMTDLSPLERVVRMGWGSLTGRIC